MLIMATGGAGEGTSGSGAGPTPGNDPEQYDDPNYMDWACYQKNTVSCTHTANALHNGWQICIPLTS